ncbi:MAG: hypothetical protein Q8S26_09545 [Azonexus sp.]|nr:hypothetical protein [Azonexus sp.]
MPPVLRHSSAPPSASSPARRDVARPGEQELASFDLRDALADMTVRETSFSEFLAELKRAGKKPN